MKIKVWYIQLIVSLLVASCSPQKEQHQIIDIKDAINKRAKIALSDLTNKKLEYVILETANNCMIGENPRFYANTQFIIVVSFRQVLLFDRKSGKFINEIGHYGRDIDGYSSTLFNYPFNEEMNTCYMKGWSNVLLEYDLNGRLIKKIRVPPRAYSVAHLGQSSFAAYIKNYSGEESIKLKIFNNKDTCVYSYPNFSTFKNTKDVVRWGSHGWFYNFKNELHFFELFNDTIYKVTENHVEPKYILSMGEFAPPYEKQSSIKFLQNESQNYCFINKLFESQRFVLFQTSYLKNSYQGVYDKKSTSTIINDNAEGFINDIDHFIPLYYSSLNAEDELICAYDAYNVKEWFNKNKKAIANLSPDLQKLQNIKETDNPVVMIAKLKE